MSVNLMQFAPALVYAIQGIAEGLISRIQGSHSGVVGLPLYETRTLLKAAGFAIA